MFYPTSFNRVHPVHRDVIPKITRTAPTINDAEMRIARTSDTVIFIVDLAQS